MGKENFECSSSPHKYCLRKKFMVSLRTFLKACRMSGYLIRGLHCVKVISQRTYKMFKFKDENVWAVKCLEKIMTLVAANITRTCKFLTLLKFKIPGFPEMRQPCRKP